MNETDGDRLDPLAPELLDRSRHIRLGGRSTSPLALMRSSTSTRRSRSTSGGGLIHDRS